MDQQLSSRMRPPLTSSTTVDTLFSLFLLSPSILSPSLKVISSHASLPVFSSTPFYFFVVDLFPCVLHVSFHFCVFFSDHVSFLSLYCFFSFFLSFSCLSPPRQLQLELELQLTSTCISQSIVLWNLC